MSQLFEARLDNYLLNILDIADSVEAAIATHEFMNTNGAILDPQGLHVHEVKFRAFFFASSINYATEYIDPTYANHFDFIQSMTDNSYSHKLIHPKYGEIDGYCRSLNIVHDDTQNYVAIDIVFAQKDIQTIGFIADATAIDYALQLQQIDLLNAQIAALNTDLASMGMGSILNQAINASQSLVDQFNHVTTGVRDFLKSVDTFLNQCDTLLNTVAEPFNTITNAVSFVNDVPSRIIGSINSCANRIIGSVSALSNTPATFMNNCVLGVVNFKNTITGTNAAFFQTKFLTISAGTIAWQSGVVFQTDDNNRAIQAVQEKKPSFNIKGERINSIVPIDVMSTQDIENILSMVRQLIQAAIVTNRTYLSSDVQQLKNIASQLVTYIDTIKINYRTTKTIQTNNIPLHLLVTQLGLPYNAAERILKLNPQIKCPNFTEGNIKVYVD